MNSKQTRTKKAIFSQPTTKNTTYEEIVSLLLTLGCKIEQGTGSRVAFIKGKKILRFHKPHPENTLKTYVIQEIRNFLLEIGVKP